MEKFSLFGKDLLDTAIIQQKGILAQKFEFPPFSVLNAREGAWQRRKRAWISLGIKSEIGRDCKVFAIGDKETWTREQKEKGGLTFKGKAASFDAYRVKEGTRKTTDTQGTSIFDPTLCELMYHWFCPEGGQIIDPFAGGSVRGIIAGILSYKYYGIELQQVQIDANETQKAEICSEAPIKWVCGDALEKLNNAPKADFIFTCPPYGNLERYSDDPADLSTMNYKDFIKAYKSIISQCSKKLKPGCMACFVVGDFRDLKTGFYQGFVADTIKIFQECGLGLYNDAILITAVGSLPIRVGKQFEAGKKLGKTHQNILIFKKE